MNLKTIAYVALISAASAAFVIGSGGPSQAKAKKMAPPPHPGPCFEIAAPVCGVKGGMKFNYANACFAAQDGAKVVSQGACPKAKAHKKAKKKAAEPAKKKEMKPAAKKPAAPAMKMDEKKKM